MKLTNEIIERGKSKRGGWSAKQLACFGIDFPLENGWKETIIDCEFPLDDINRFLDLKDAHIKKDTEKYRQKTNKHFRQVGRQQYSQCFNPHYNDFLYAVDKDD